MDILKLLPPHNSGMMLEHNRHRGYNQTAAAAIAEDEHYDWENEDAKQIAAATDEIWSLQWWPRGTSGFHSIAAPTLHDLLRIANSGRYQ